MSFTMINKRKKNPFILFLKNTSITQGYQSHVYRFEQ